MRKFLFAASSLALLMMMTSCRRHQAMVVPPPPPASSPSPRTVPVHTSLAIPHTTMADLPEIPEPRLPSVTLGGTTPYVPPRRDKDNTRNQTATANDQADKPSANTSSTSGGEPPSTTPIGELSAAPNTQGLPSSSNISKQIAWIQKQLQGIHRVLNSQQQHTASQVRTFLAKAKNALQAGDLDAAHTLTVKARVLLGELQ